METKIGELRDTILEFKLGVSDSKAPDQWVSLCGTMDSLKRAGQSGDNIRKDDLFRNKT